MAKEQARSNVTGVSAIGVVQIIFIVLKLIGTITWSWWWVLAPTWMPIGLIGVILITALLAAAIATLIKGVKKNK